MSVKPLSYRQSQAIRFWINGGRKSKADALRKAGYSDAVIHQPQRVFGSQAVMRELERLGHGSLGILNGQKPKEVIQPIKLEPKYTFDIQALTKEQIQDIQERFDNTPPSPKAFERMEKEKERKARNNTTSIKSNPNCNVFGERLPNSPEPEKKMKMSDFSSI